MLALTIDEHYTMRIWEPAPQFSRRNHTANASAQDKDRPGIGHEASLCIGCSLAMAQAPCACYKG